MKTRKNIEKAAYAVILLSVLWQAIPGVVDAHCDTMDGPVVVTAKAALEKGDVTPVLKWVKKDDEKEIREFFQKTLVVRSKGKEAKELADMYFFETLVRIHRAGEGAPYTGLRSEPTELIIVAADKSLETGSVDNLIKHMQDDTAAGIRKRFTRMMETKKNADESIESGREFVEAYVDFTHYVERMHMDAMSHGAHHAEATEMNAGEPHHH